MLLMCLEDGGPFGPGPLVFFSMWCRGRPKVDIYVPSNSTVTDDGQKSRVTPDPVVSS